MGIKRGSWNSAPSDHPPVIRTSNSGARPVDANTKQSLVFGVSGKGEAFKQVSEFRREMFAEKNNESSPAVPLIVYSNSYKTTQRLKGDFTKTAASSVAGVGSTYGHSGSSSSVRQAPEVYSPLFQMANLQLPRDRI